MTKCFKLQYFDIILVVISDNFEDIIAIEENFLLLNRLCQALKI